MKILESLFAKISTAIALMTLYAVLVAIATFIENDYGSTAAKALVYNSWFFNMLHLWILIVLVGAIWRYRLIQNKKYASLILHCSFIVIIIGAGITRFFGHEGIMHIREGESASSYMSAENYLNIFVRDGERRFQLHIPANISYAANKKLDEKITFGNKTFRIKSTSIAKMSSDKKNHMMVIDGIISYENKEIPLQLIGGEGNGIDVVVDLDENTQAILNYGAREMELGFNITLDDFILTRYAGSNAPSSYESKITLDDGNKSFPYEIYMNHTLDYGGYRFFQSSYDPDELGTILSVNNDPGKIPTYFGYFLLILGSIWIIFAKNSRFKKLASALKSQQLYGIIFILFIALPIYANAESNATQSIESNLTQIDKENLIAFMELFRANSINHSKQFGELLVQDFGGRIKPLDTLASDVVHKITKVNNFLDLSASQVVFGMIFFPEEWKFIKMIYVKTPQLREILGIPKNEKYASLMDVMPNFEYKLSNYSEEANRKKPSERSKFDNDVLSVDERASIALFLLNYLKILPMPSDGAMWVSPKDALEFGSDEFRNKIAPMFSDYLSGAQMGVQNNDWSLADSALERIKQYQNQTSNKDILLSQNKLKAEIFFNNLNAFKQLIIPYLLLGIFIFILIFIHIFSPKPQLKMGLKLLYWICVLLAFVHFGALILRWYISGHAPWSNAYESMLYASFISALAGLLFFAKSYLAVSASMVFAGIALLVANLGFMDPQIGNLVPVLKSYWLNIHVSVITASYGFLGLCFLLGIIALLVMIFRKDSNKKLDSVINSLTIINEMSMILGLVLLCVGNFLGGIWANESWGRYWGWDPKETWSLISIGVYAIILHLRFIFKKNLQFILATSSVIGFFSILMTFFGVNYYLSGLHSYAGGDPIPVPNFLYVMIIAIILLIALAARKRQMESVKLKGDR